MPVSGFTLHPQLEQDTFFLADWQLCRVLLMNNRLYPWLILVPRAEAAREIIDLSAPARHRLMDEIALASEALRAQFAPDKLNVASLGNQVPQLHVHVIARFATDSAWPNPVWGKGTEPYGDAEPLIGRLRQQLGG